MNALSRSNTLTMLVKINSFLKLTFIVLNVFQTREKIILKVNISHTLQPFADILLLEILCPVPQ